MNDDGYSEAEHDAMVSEDEFREMVESEEPNVITVLDLAIFRGAKANEDGSMTLGAIEETGLPFFGGCSECGASIAAYNASPSRSGYLKCASGCIGSDGFATVQEANIALFPEEYEWKGPAKDRKTEDDRND